jgi:hypothetical protein
MPLNTYLRGNASADALRPLPRRPREEAAEHYHALRGNEEVGFGRRFRRWVRSALWSLGSVGALVIGFRWGASAIMSGLSKSGDRPASRANPSEIVSCRAGRSFCPPRIPPGTRSLVRGRSRVARTTCCPGRAATRGPWRGPARSAGLDRAPASRGFATRTTSCPGHPHLAPALLHFHTS